MPAVEFVRSTALPVKASDAFAWHGRPGAFERLVAPWERVRVVKRTGGIESGARVELRVAVGPVPTKWVLEHRDTVEGRSFSDVLLSGPFPEWRHDHVFEDVATGSTLRDEIRFRAPGPAFVEKLALAKLDRLFAWRHETLRGDLLAHHGQPGDGSRVLVSGAGGLVGSALCAFLTSGGWAVDRLVRFGREGEGRVLWDPAQGAKDTTRLEGYDAIVHLAGENIASGPWSSDRKTRIRNSRVFGTRRLAEQIGRTSRPPRVFVAASAVGYYGDRGDEILDEDAERGSGFLASVCRDWEAAGAPAARAGVRTVNLRIGIVLGGRGGFLSRLLPAFRLGLGGQIGNGRQYMSWIGRDDLLDAILRAMTDERLRGAVNAVAPEPVTNRDFTKTLGRVLARPTFARVPAAVPERVLGEMGRELVLSSTRVVPGRLAAAGHTFRHAALEDALRHYLGRRAPGA